ncbi:MAG: DUF2059 domain-containing protein [Terriglobales bacterium]
MRLTACLLVLAWAAMPLSAQAPAPPAQTATKAAASGAPGAPPAISPGERADIQALLAANGEVEATQAGVRRMASLLDRMLPPAAFKRRLLQLYTQEVVTELRPVQARIWTDEIARHYSDAEIRELTAFYRSPLGRKVVAMRSVMRAEVQARGKVVGPRLGREAMIKVLKEHPELAREMRQAERAAAAQRQR